MKMERHEVVTAVARAFSTVIAERCASAEEVAVTVEECQEIIDHWITETRKD